MSRTSMLYKILISFFLLIVATSSFANTKHCKKHGKYVSSHVKNKKYSKMISMRSSHKHSCKHKVVYVKPKPVCAKKVVRYAPCKIRRRPCYKDAVFKDQPPCCKGLCDGFYLGLAGGVDSYRIRQQSTVGLPDIITFTTNPALNAVGLVSELYAGYGYYFNNTFYAGAEIFANLPGASTSYRSAIVTGAGDTATATTRIYADRVYGIALLPGIKINDYTLGYLRLGYNRAGITTNESFSVFGLASGESNRRNWTNGISYGIGLETLVYQNWSVRGEYTHTEYQSFNGPGMVITNVETSDITVPGSVYFPSNNEYMVGVSYHF